MNPFFTDKDKSRIWNDYFSNLQYSKSMDSIIGIGFSYFYSHGKKLKTTKNELHMEHSEESR